MSEKGIAFRNTTAYVTDGANDSPLARTNVTDGQLVTGVTLANGLTIRVGPGAVGSQFDGRDRKATNDPRIAGMMFGGAGDYFEIDWPSGAGQYDIRAGIGDPDANNPATHTIDFLDDTTPLFTASATTVNLTDIVDANSAVLTNVAWPGSNTRKRVTAAGTSLRVRCSGNPLCYVSLEKVASGPVLDHIIVQVKVGGTPTTTVKDTDSPVASAVGYDNTNTPLAVQPTFTFASAHPSTAPINASTGAITPTVNVSGQTDITASSGGIASPAVTLTVQQRYDFSVVTS